MERTAWFELEPYYVRHLDLEPWELVQIHTHRNILEAGYENELFEPIVRIPEESPKPVVRDFTKGISENPLPKGVLYDIRNMYETDLFH